MAGRRTGCGGPVAVLASVVLLVATAATAAPQPARAALAQAPPAVAPVLQEPVGEPQAPPADTVEAALRWSAQVPDGGAGTVVVARSDLFPDALASGPVQGALAAPLLLTPPDRLDDRVAAEVERLGTTSAVLLGGEVALTPAVAHALQRQGVAVERVAGGNRIETALALARRFHADARAALVARAFPAAGDPTSAFADALAAGAVAARLDVPVLLSATAALDPATAAYVRDGPIEDVLVVGGEAALAPAVEAGVHEAGASVRRVAGDDRTATALALARLTGAPDTLAEPVVVVDGSGADAWAAGFAAASRIGARDLLLTRGSAVPDATHAHLLARGLGVECGPGVLPAACDGVRAADTAAGLRGSLVAVLTGDEVEGGGAPGTGRAVLRPTAVDDAICYAWLDHDLVFPVVRVTVVAHVGAVDGPVVLELGGGRHASRGCLVDVPPGAIDAVLEAPAAHVVHLASLDLPEGALRGALRRVADVAVAPLDGAAAVAGAVLLTTDTGPCWAVNAGTLHGRLAGVAVVGPGGDRTATFEVPQPGASAAGCPAAGAPATAIADAVSDPASHAVEVDARGTTSPAARGALRAG